MPMLCWESQVVNFVFLLQIMVIKHYYILQNELKILTPSLINIKSSTCPTLLVLSLRVSTLTQLLFPCWSHYVIYWTSPITLFFFKQKWQRVCAKNKKKQKWHLKFAKVLTRRVSPIDHWYIPRYGTMHNTINTCSYLVNDLWNLTLWVIGIQTSYI